MHIVSFKQLQLGDDSATTVPVSLIEFLRAASSSREPCSAHRHDPVSLFLLLKRSITVELIE